MFSEGGISHTGDLLDTGITYKVIEKTGNTYNFGDNKLGVGRENAKTFLKENPKVAQEIEKAIRRQAKDVDLALVDSNPAPVL